MSEIERLFWQDDIPATKKKGKGKSSNQRVTKNATEKYLKAWPFLPNCRHWRQRFELEGGLNVFASAIMDRPRKARAIGAFSGSPDIGFYLSNAWTSDKVLVSPGLTLPFMKSVPDEGRAIIWPWEDYGIPDDRRTFEKAIRWLLKQAEKGKVIEIGCMGGHGRTGTVLACLLVLQGLSPSNAFGRVQSEYCLEAVESRAQYQFVREIGA
jgi:hypothetical protein